MPGVLVAVVTGSTSPGMYGAEDDIGIEYYVGGLAVRGERDGIGVRPPRSES